MKDDRLTEMKHAYENIPIPGELKACVQHSIDDAKRELETEAATEIGVFHSRKTDGTADPAASGTHSSVSRKKEGKDSAASSAAFGKRPMCPLRRIALRTASAAAAVLLLITVMANSGERIAYAMEGIPFLNAIVRVVTFREYNHSSNNMEAIVKTPTIQVEDMHGNPLEDASNELNRQIESYTSQIIQAYERDVEASGGVGHEAVDLDYTIVTNNDRLFSLRFDQLTVMAGSSHSVKIYHLDKLTGQLITLKDLFRDGSDYITRLSDSVKAQMAARMSEDGSATYFYGSDYPCEFEAISPDENFYISERGTLTLVFDKYEVAPGYMGALEFEIPTEEIRDIIKDGFVR